jgi:hypothetical protein
MKITEGTKISELIKSNPDAIEVIASINDHFRKLRNPILRKILAPRVTISDAAKIGGCSVDIFFEKLAEIGFMRDKSAANPEDKSVPSFFSIPSDYDISKLDVRGHISDGKDPFLMITRALDNLATGKYLLLINSFEPVPLIKILREKNYLCNVHPEGEAIYTYIKKTETSARFSARAETLTKDFENKLAEYTNKLKILDVSAMEMPGPMVTILKELDELPLNVGLFVKHRKIPHFLIPELKMRGINILIRECGENSVELLIYR